MRFKIGISLILFRTSKGAKKNEDGIWRRGGGERGDRGTLRNIDMANGSARGV